MHCFVNDPYRVPEVQVYPNLSCIEEFYYNANVYNATPHWTLTYCFPSTI